MCALPAAKIIDREATTDDDERVTCMQKTEAVHRTHPMPWIQAWTRPRRTMPVAHLEAVRMLKTMLVPQLVMVDKLLPKNNNYGNEGLYGVLVYPRLNVKGVVRDKLSQRTLAV